jgi:hypothetical protein
MTHVPQPEGLTSSDSSNQPGGLNVGLDSGVPAESRSTECPPDSPVPVSVVLDRLRDAAAAHDDDLTAFSVPTVPGPRRGSERADCPRARQQRRR